VGARYNDGAGSDAGHVRVFDYDGVLKTKQIIKEDIVEIPGDLRAGCPVYWESIEVPDGYEKPPKEAFDAKLKELVDAQPLKDLRAERDRRLQAVDWVVIRATSTSTPVPEAWVTYMQALRDLPATTGDPKNPVWPVQPSP
jgi:hypothetical protein